MKSIAAVSVRLGLVSLLLACTGCLPADTRPPPGEAILTISADEALLSGFDTSDGWRIEYHRYVLSLGEVGLAGEGCNPYAESDYLRIVDLRRPGGQTVNTMHALGACELSFRLQSPNPSAVLGPGVDEATRAFMRTPAADAFGPGRGVVVQVAGTARRADRVVRFDWSFRRNLVYEGCGTVSFEPERTQTLDLRVHGATLFQEPPGAASAAPAFEAFAAADADADGEVTLDELAQVGAATPGPHATLLEQLYLGRMPRLPHLGDADSCSPAPLPDD
jgi:hypothetical protein